MFEKPSPQQLAERAVKLLDLAEKYESQQNWTKAIETYSKAAELLKLSGLLKHHVEDIYERITHLKEMSVQTKKLLRDQTESRLSSLRDEAFYLLDEAKALEKTGRYHDAITRYSSAISLLAQAGWDESQLGSIRLKLEQLAKLFREQQNIAHQRALQSTQIPTEEQKSFRAPESELIPAEIDTQSKLKIELEAKKQKEEDIQDRAFDLIDAGKKLLNEKIFDMAKSKYFEAIDLLKTIGWTEQNLAYIYEEIESIGKQKETFEKMQIKSEAGADMLTSLSETSEITPQKEIITDSMDIQSKAILEYEKKRKLEAEIQNNAFKLMDEGESLIKNKQFNEAIEKYGMASQLLESIGWTEQLIHINTIIEKINIDKKNYEIAKASQIKAKEAALVKPTREISEQDISDIKVKKLKILEFEERKRKEEQIQNDAFKKIDIAKQLEREKQYDNAIDNFNEAIELLKSIGWNDYIKPLYKFISDIKERKENEQQILDLKKAREKENLEFQEMLQKRVKSQIEGDEKELLIKRKELEKKREIESIKEKKAFKIISEADEFVLKADYENAILTYKKALNIFREMEWTEQIATIETTIKTVQQKYKDFLNYDEKSKALKEKRLKEEEEFRNAISEQIRIEREKIENKKIAVREYEKEIEYRQKRKIEAFSILDSAEKLTLSGNFDGAIEKYHEASIILAEIQWNEELLLVQNAIRQLENKNKEKEILKQKAREEALKREEETRKFQKKIVDELRKERERLREKEIALREHEKEVKYREKRKEEAFKLIDEAQKLTISGDFDTAIETYHEVSIILAEIQWKDELALIQNAIQELNNKKREKDLWEQKSREDLFKREEETRKFQEIITLELRREREKLKEREIALREHEKEVQYREKRKNEAFDILDSAEVLITMGDLEATIEKYHEASIILAEIQWTEELNLIQQAIRQLRKKIKEKELWEQKIREDAFKNEQEAREFQRQISLKRKQQEEKIKMSQYLQEQQKILSENQLKKQNKALENLEIADNHIKMGELDKAIEIYINAIKIFNEIEWKGPYLRVIQDTLENLNEKKREIEFKIQKQTELAAKHEAEEREFQAKIAQSLEAEKQKMLEKKIAVQTQEQLFVYRERQREEAFDVMEKAEELLKDGNFDESLTLYRQADIILSEIQFPSNAVKEMIQKIKSKQKEQELLRQKEREIQIQRQFEEETFQREITNHLERESEKMRVKKIAIETQEKLKVYREQRREEAFKVLEEAEQLTKIGNFILAINTYRNAELILSEIQYPIDIIHDVIKEVQIKRVEQEKLKQKEREASLQREKEEKEFQEKIARELRKESEKIREREIALREYEKEVEYREDKKDEAFSILDEAQKLTISGDFDGAIEKYQKTAIILAEIQWTDELAIIQNAIKELENKKKERDLWEQKMREEALKKDQEIREFQEKIAENLRKEREKLKEKEIAIREYEKEVQYREEKKEEAFKILDEAEKLTVSGEFNAAIERYYKASIILAEIQWTEELALIQNAIRELENKKKERELWEQKSREQKLRREQETRIFQENIAKTLEKEREQLREREIALREYEKEVEYRENRKNEAFGILETAEVLTRKGNFESAIEKYHEASIIFAEIQWTEELTLIQNAIRELENKKKERDLWQQKMREEALKREQEARDFQFNLSLIKKEREEKIKMTEYIQEQRKALSKKYLKKQEEALLMLEKADEDIKRGKLNEGIGIYISAEKIFNEIGWDPRYLKVIQDTLDNLNKRKIEIEKIKQNRIKLATKHEAEEKEFQEKIAQSIESEKKKMLEKKIAVQTQEQLLTYREKRREEAFNIMDKAKDLLQDGKFEDSLKHYLQADIILSEIQFPSNVVKEMIQQIKLKQKEQEELVQKERELEIQKQLEEEAFQKEITRQLELEKEKMKAKEIAIEAEEKIQAHYEERRQEAFKKLDEAEQLIKTGNFELAVKVYQKAALLLNEIQFPVEPIYAMINKIQLEKAEQEQYKQKEIEVAVQYEQETRKFQEEIAEKLEKERKKLKEKEIALREQKKEEQYREMRKSEAFAILDVAKELINKGSFEAAIEKYHEASIIFAEIQWIDELTLIQNAIREIENKKKERDLWEQKLREEGLKREQEEREFQIELELIKQKREEKIKISHYIQEQQIILSEQNLQRQNEALKMLDDADKLIPSGKIDEAIDIYISARKIFSELGWEKPYLKVIQDTIDNLSKRKIEIQQIELERRKISTKKEAEEREFQAKIAQSIEVEKQKMLEKKIAVQTQEQLLAYREKRREEAFNVMEKAEVLLKNGKFEESITLYRQADIILSEIQFPSNVVKEMIQKIISKQKEQELSNQKERELQIQRQLEQEAFHKEITQHLELEKEQITAKKIALEGQKIIQDYREQRREEAFGVLDEAENLIKIGNFKLAINAYRNAALILSGIQYPVDTIHEMIKKVQSEEIEQEQLRHKEREASLQKEFEERYLEEQINQQIEIEKERMKAKSIALKTRDEIKTFLEQRREEAFKVLDEAENLTKIGNFDKAIEIYRKAALILSEIQYPLESINEMIRKVQLKRVEQEQIQQREREALLQMETEEAELRAIIEERKRQEEELKRAKVIAIKQREELIEKIENRREVAFSLLENADKFLKKYPPDFDKAIELYLEARTILLEINWEPEIKHLDELIRNLRKEKQNFLIQQKEGELARIRAAEEYNRYQKEILRKKLEVQRAQEEQRSKLQAFRVEQEKRAKFQQIGLNLLDNAKKSVSLYKFNVAYEEFDQAIEKFKEIGWFEQIKFIEKEIENTKNLEANVIRAREEVKRAQEALLKQKELEELRQKEEEKVKKQSVRVITALSDEIIESLKQQRIEQEKVQDADKIKIKSGAVTFAKELGNMIQIKQNLMAEIKKVEEEEKKKKAEKEKERVKEELKELHKWIKDASKKSKKK